MFFLFGQHILKICVFISDPGLTETDLEEMAMHETEDNKVFQRFKKKIAPEPHQVKIIIIKKKKLNYKIWEYEMNSCSHCISISIVFVCSGGALQSGGLSFVGFLTTHSLCTGCPTVSLWCPADFWVSGSHI